MEQPQIVEETTLPKGFKVLKRHGTIEAKNRKTKRVLLGYYLSRDQGQGNVTFAGSDMSWKDRPGRVNGLFDDMARAVYMANWQVANDKKVEEAKNQVQILRSSTVTLFHANMPTPEKGGQVNSKLTKEELRVIDNLRVAFKQQHKVLESGRHVETRVDAIRFMLQEFGREMDK